MSWTSRRLAWARASANRLLTTTASHLQPVRRRRAGFFLLALGLQIAANAADAQNALPGMQGGGAPENTGPNKNLVSSASGHLSRGSVFEDWQLLTHPDGSRTLLVWQVDGRRGTQSDAIFRVAADSSILAGYVHEQPRSGSARSEFARDRLPGLATGISALAQIQGGQTQPNPPLAKPAAAPGNSNLKRAGVVRWAKGRYAYTTFKDGRARGTEDFHLTVHADGSRSLTMWHDIFARHSQFSVNLNIDAAQRPTLAFISYWTVNGYKGSTFIKVDGSQLLADYRGQSGDLKQALAVPAQFSIGSHPVAGDGWHTFSCDGAVGRPGNARVYSMEATADLSKPMLGELTDMPCEAFGAERITVPGGTFDTLHFRLGGVSDIWITQQDRMMVKFTTEKFDRAYTLVEFQGEGFAVAAHKRRT